VSESGPARTGGRRPASLRLRLTLLSTVTLLVSLAVVGLALDAAYRRSTEANLAQQMETWAYGLMAAMEVTPERAVVLSVKPADPLLVQPGSGVYARIDSSGDAWRSDSALGVVLPEAPSLSPGETVFLTPSADEFYRRGFGLAWQFEEGGQEPLTVSVLVHQSQVAPALASFRAGLWRSLGAAAVLLVLAQLLFAAISLRPLRKVAADVARVEAGEAERLAGPYPAELEPLTRNVDRLLATEQANQARYRHALDSLAHSLKTPLAVLKAGQDGVPDPAASRAALEDMERLIATRLERAAAGTRRAMAAPVAVAPVAERIAATLRKVHSQHLRTLECNIEPGLSFYGEERDLMELLGNLLDNACKYGDGLVRLDASSIAPAGPSARSGLRLAVGNDGAPAALGRLVQRGLRGDQRAEGHGLGLNIVSEVANAYGGRIGFGVSPLGGAEVVVTIPPEDSRPAGTAAP
jgi:two-component system sensor histidine kinase PhoQ